MTTPQFDPGSPYASLKAHDINGYLRATVRDETSPTGFHPLADNRGRTRLHRAVLYDGIGPGPHDCHWCGIGGLRWDAAQSDVDYLTVDHVDHDKVNDMFANLVPTHKWCNDNRFIVERLGIPWDRIAAIPLASRPALQTRDREPTQAAHDLATTRPAIEESACSSVAHEESGEAATSPAPTALATPAQPTGVHRMYAWGDFCDLADLAKGVVTLKGPPEWLKAKHPKLRKVDHLWGRK
jgi:hypothetical protein